VSVYEVSAELSTLPSPFDIRTLSGELVGELEVEPTPAHRND
jgi:hypothetical protein